VEDCCAEMARSVRGCPARGYCAGRRVAVGGLLRGRGASRAARGEGAGRKITTEGTDFLPGIWSFLRVTPWLFLGLNSEELGGRREEWKIVVRRGRAASGVARREGIARVGA
jgi:hypothetical protein